MTTYIFITKLWISFVDHIDANITVDTLYDTNISSIVMY